jgi:glycerate 2-kinase
MDLRKAIVDIFNEGLNAVLPEKLFRDAIVVRDDGLIIEGRHYSLDGDRRVHVFGSGKASLAMAKALEDIMQDRIAGGLIVSNYGNGSLQCIDISIGAHPLPDERSIHAADLMIERLSGLSKDDFFIYLLSGGSSSLIEKPYLKRPPKKPLKILNTLLSEAI